MLIKDFYEKAAKDEELQKKIAEAVKSGKSIEEIMKDFGIDGTVDDLKAYAENAVAEGKLNKSQLDEAAGGTTPTLITTTIPAAGVGISVASLLSC